MRVVRRVRRLADGMGTPVESGGRRGHLSVYKEVWKMQGHLDGFCSHRANPCVLKNCTVEKQSFSDRERQRPVTNYGLACQSWGLLCRLASARGTSRLGPSTWRKSLKVMDL